MINFKTSKPLSQYLSRQRAAGKRIGFVPTMGALHPGHLSLIDLAKAENRVCVCSIFINPTQFNNENDFLHYPVTVEKDIQELLKRGCHALFLPNHSEIYPEGFQARYYELGALENILEGHFRPGHFQGVCQVVDRLLEIIEPDDIFLGQKDFQQCLVIDHLLTITGRRIQTHIAIAPTVREPGGLAMSSRNTRLNENEFQTAKAISEALYYIKDHALLQPVAELELQAMKYLSGKGLSVDYVTIADAGTLAKTTTLNKPAIALIAVTVGKVRLIDNMLLN
ncbi:MAG: pantoate--beta-alanine ligase [Chitinophagaceae bacterium]